MQFFATIVVECGLAIFILGIGGLFLSEITNAKILTHAVTCLVTGPVILAGGAIWHTILVLSEKES